MMVHWELSAGRSCQPKSRHFAWLLASSAARSCTWSVRYVFIGSPFLEEGAHQHCEVDDEQANGDDPAKPGFVESGIGEFSHKQKAPRPFDHGAGWQGL